jgi:hypothetical protein
MPASTALRMKSLCLQPSGTLMWRWFETSVAGRTVTSLGLIVTLAAVSVSNMPESEIKDALIGWAQPYMNATGLDLDWGVFAPNPRDGAYYVEGRIDYVDGTTSVWRFPTRSNLWAYSDYRWQKLEEWVRLDENRDSWRPFAEYLANDARRDGRAPTRVTLLRRWADTLPPGPGPEHGQWREFVFYAEPVG